MTRDDDATGRDRLLLWFGGSGVRVLVEEGGCRGVGCGIYRVLGNVRKRSRRRSGFCSGKMQVELFLSVRGLCRSVHGIGRTNVAQSLFGKGLGLGDC